jgi:hypothetical protein
MLNVSIISLSVWLYSPSPAPELHILEYFKQKNGYLEAFEQRQPCFFRQLDILEPFSDLCDASGYNNKSITDEMITEIYLEFSNRTQKAKSDSYLHTRTGELK